MRIALLRAASYYKRQCYIEDCWEICKKKASRIANYKMHVIEDGDNIKYTFKMKPGVSKVEGGVRILKEMNYPDEMIRAMREEA
jgi:DNA mismatch repair ATPase MutS